MSVYVIVTLVIVWIALFALLIALGRKWLIKKKQKKGPPPARALALKIAKARVANKVKPRVDLNERMKREETSVTLGKLRAWLNVDETDKLEK